MPRLPEFSTEEIAKFLRKALIFSELPDRDLTGLAKQITVRSYDRGSFVLHRGEEGLGLYLILSGEVEVRTRSRLLTNLGEGQFFGEMSLLDSEWRSADIVARSPTVVGILTRWEFEAFAHLHRGVYKGMARELARRLRATTRSFSE
jgi:CRP-like cAMP-binding protein